jgi:hypothetical protein
MATAKPQLGRNPCMVDGRTSRKTYLVTAAHADIPTLNAVGVRKLGVNEFKFHLWPDARQLGLADYLNKNHSHRVYTRPAGQSMSAYTGVVLNRAETEKFLDHIKTLPFLTVAKREHIMEVLDGKSKASRLGYNPHTGFTETIGANGFGGYSDDE